MAALYPIPSVHRQIHSYPNGALLFWGMLVFWCVAWPWILTAGHRPFARKALDHILLDELKKSGANDSPS